MKTINNQRNVIAVLDFGSQYSHLIVRRIRELGVYAELLSPETPAEKLFSYAGIILSGGPQNLSDSDALKADPHIFTLGLPILGICYGMQLIAHQLGGKVKAGTKREYGSTKITLSKSSLFTGLKPEQTVWMSHGDQVTKIPKGFNITGKSNACKITAIEDTKRRIYGIKFHPEVKHTPNGMQIIKNFIDITGA